MSWQALHLGSTQTRLSSIALLFFAALQVGQSLNAQGRSSQTYNNHPKISTPSGPTKGGTTGQKLSTSEDKKVIGTIQEISSQSIKVANLTFKLTKDTKYRSIRNSVQKEVSRDYLKVGLTAQVVFTVEDNERTASKVSITDCDCNKCPNPKKCDCCNG
jgi:hypothetical protein